MVAKKLRAVLAAGMTPIVCVGETLEERDQGATDNKVRGQVEAALNGLASEDAVRCIVAYEPIWAIGTGRNATPEDANGTIKVIRDHIRLGLSDAVADGIRILYGGSVKPGNVAELMAEPEIDGGLVGGASLDPDDFARVVQYGAS
jgi:triosephosphate isomerase (TIM)